MFKRLASINVTQLTKALERSALIDSVEKKGNQLIVTSTLKATNANGSTDRIHAFIVTTVQNCGGYSRAVPSAEKGWTDDGAGIWHVNL